MHLIDYGAIDVPVGPKQKLNALCQTDPGTVIEAGSQRFRTTILTCGEMLAYFDSGEGLLAGSK